MIIGNFGKQGPSCIQDLVIFSSFVLHPAGILLVAALSSQSHEAFRGQSESHGPWRWQALSIAPQYESISAISPKQIDSTDMTLLGQSSEPGPQIQSVILTCHPEGQACYSESIWRSSWMCDVTLENIFICMLWHDFASHPKRYIPRRKTAGCCDQWLRWALVHPLPDGGAHACPSRAVAMSRWVIG